MVSHFSLPDQVDPVRLSSWAPKGKRWTTLSISSSPRVKPSCPPRERGAQMYPKLFHHQSMWRGNPPAPLDFIIIWKLITDVTVFKMNLIAFLKLIYRTAVITLVINSM